MCSSAPPSTLKDLKTYRFLWIDLSSIVFTTKCVLVSIKGRSEVHSANAFTAFRSLRLGNWNYKNDKTKKFWSMLKSLTSCRVQTVLYLKKFYFAKLSENVSTLGHAQVESNFSAIFSAHWFRLLDERSFTSSMKSSLWSSLIRNKSEKNYGIKLY